MSEYKRTKHKNWLKGRNNLKSKSNLTSHDNLSVKTDHIKHFASANQKNKWKRDSHKEPVMTPYTGAKCCRYSFSNPDGTLLYYQIIGDGAPLVLLHGCGQQHLVFHQQIEYFKNRYKLILIDAKPTGLSSFGPFNLVANSLAEGTVRVLDHLHIRKAVILGYGDGGNTALQLAFKAPWIMKALILIDTNIASKEFSAAVNSLQTVQSKVLGSLKKSKIPQNEKRTAQPKVGAPHLSAKELAKLKVPTLIISAGKDTLRSKYAKKLADSIPHSEHICINRAGHMGILTHSEEYNFILQNILKKLEV